MLVGDPMAPQQSASRSERHSDEEPDIPGLNTPSQAKVIGIAAGGVLVIAAIGYAAARLMGLLN
jgi:hypothetical protein